MVAVGYPMIKQPLEELSEHSKQSMHKLCSLFDRSKDRKAWNKCYQCSEPVRDEHSVQWFFVLPVINKENRNSNNFFTRLKR